MELQGKVVLVTGASMGIGLEVARALVREGARVAFAARTLDKLEAAAREYGAQALAVQMDVTNDESVRAAVERIERELGSIDVVVNNAGNGGVLSLWQATEFDYLRRMFDVHVFGSERVIRAVVPSMLRRRFGVIVNFASTIGYVAMPGSAAYNAAKAAVVMLSRTLRAELRPSGIDVRVFSPPHTSTESGREMPLNLPKIFEPPWVAEQLVRFLKGNRAEVLPGGNGTLLVIQRVWPGLAHRIMEKIGFGALERAGAQRLLPRSSDGSAS
ncbi:SDR family NAD(P)-dependent oxidoreductase [Haliangium sp.]|uniref:SDR family NAD(P)-dependent oxidoreductase n=1 Tax=Haliangium sp. TaxID=2663208 RepID=UPI003D0B8E33